MQSIKSINYLILVALLFFLFPNLNGQTNLQGGDIAILGVNANNSACGGGGGEDVITFVAFKDIVNTTQFDMTDNGWERVFSGLWGDSEGTLRFERTGGTITAGTTFEIIFGANLGATLASNPDWTITDLNVAPVGTLNMNSSGDQIYIMHNGVWDNMGVTGDHDATYTGKILFGFNTRTTWNADGGSGQSNLHPEVDPCYYMNPTSGTTNYVHYTGPTSVVSQLDWISRISDPTNWSSYLTCLDYNTVPPLVPTVIPIAPSGMSIDCSTCSANCPGFNETLIFNLPTSGGPFNVVYTDGISNFTLNSINDQHVESLIINQSTTFSLVSVTALNGCPIYSNFDGEAVVTISGSGSGGNAVLSGGGVLCTDNCTVITVTISGGTAPYLLDAVVNFPPLVNNFPISTPATVTNFDINVCSQGVIPIYDISTNTLSLPNFITGNLSFALTGLTDNSGCVGTVDPTPLSMTIEQTPTANAAGPMNECDEGGNTATFDLASLNSTVNGGGSNTVAWYEDITLNTAINNTSSYSTTSTTVYATTSTVDCESEPVAVQLIVNPSPTANSASLTACTSTGIATFDLTSVNSTVNGGTGFTVNWFTNIAGTNPILTPTNYTSNTSTVYATVTNSGCTSNIVAILLTVNQAPMGVSTTMTVCESMNIPTFGDFDLTTLNTTVNGGTGLPVAWFTNVSATNPIPGSFITAQNNTIVYAVVGTAPCASTATPVTLLVTPFPPAVSTILQECATFGNQAVFDLTSVDNIINAGSGAPVTWFEDIAGMNQIVLPESYLSTSTFVYAQTSNGLCTSPIQPVELIVIPGVTANTTSAAACDSGNGTATFDLNVIGLNVNSDPGNTVNWYFDSNATIPIPSPYTTVSTNVYAQVTNGVCESQVVTISLAIDSAPTANITSATLCDSGNGTANFDLNVIALDVNSNSGNTVNWFSDVSGNFPISSPYNTGSTIIYAEVTNGNCNSPIIPITLNVEAAPVANNAFAAVCDLGNGTGDFDLTLIENDVNSTFGNTVSWFLDLNATIPISSPYNTTSTIVYAIVSNGNCNSNTAEIILSVEAAPVANATISDGCDIGNGTTDFDLDAIAMMVNTNSAYTVTWFLSANGTNPILVSPFNTSTTIVYAVVSDGAGCESVPTQVDLNVVPTPIANTTSFAACDSGNGTASFDLTALENTVNGGSANAVSWYSDITGINLISSPYNTGSTTVYAIVIGALCNSQPVAVDLTVNSAPIANSTDASACINDGSGAADFDLTSLESIVNGGSGNSVLWYSDAGTANQIFSPYNTSTTTIYATVTVGNCPSAAVPVDLMVGDQPTANTASAELCDSGNGTATFDLTNLENTINGGTSDPVNFFSDIAGTILISSPYNTASTTVYATVTVGFCSSELVAIDLTVGNSPTANTASASLCDEGGGMASFDLTSLENTVGAGNIVTWYSDAAATNIIASPFSTTTTMIYAVVGDANCASDPVAIDLTVGNLPTATAATTSLCDDGNGTATFDLTSLENTVNGGSGNTVLWYSDATATTTITSPFLTSSTTIYAIVDNGNCLSNTAAVDLNVTTAPSISTASSTLCDEGSGMANFDLTSLENTVNGGSGNSVTWYSDANGTTPILSPFNSATATIYAIVSDGNCTSPIEAIDLTVANLPEANSATIANCDSGNGTADFDLNAIANTVNGGNGNPVTWFSDINLTTSITSPFNSAATTIYAVVNDAICTASAVEVTLEITNDIAANPTSLSACDDGTGSASFDLTDLNFQNNITGGNGNSISWFIDAAATNPLSPPFDAFVTVPTSIYGVVVSGNCSSVPVEISLVLLPEVPVANNFSFSNCDEGNGTASFDLDSQTDIVNTGNGNQVIWFEDQNLTISITSPFVSASTMIYAVATDGICFSETVEVELTVDNNLTAFPTTDSQCDDGSGTATFDLTTLENTVNGGNGNTVNWYSDAAAATSIPTTIISGNTSVYAIVTDGTCASQIVEITLTVDNNLTAFPTADSQCDDGSGTATFDLTTLENTVNGGNGNTVNWYSDAAAATSIPTTIISGNTSVYAIVTDGTCASQIVEITLTVDNNLTAFPTTDSQCDDGSGAATFDLTTLENMVNGGNGNTVNWYSDEAATTSIPTTIISGNTSVYAIVTDGTCASQIVEITLTVDNNLTAFPTADSQCDDGSGTATFDLTTLENTVNGGNGNTVNWYSDAAATTSIPTTIISGNTSVYAIVTDGTCASQIVEITLTVDNNLTAFPTADSQCDDGSGTATFDLTTLENTVNGGNGNTVNWYSDAAAATSIPTTIISGNTSVYAIVTDGTCASQIVEITLTVDNNLTAFPTTDSQCDDGSGTATFDLTTLENTVNGGNGNTVNWYSDAAAATSIPTTIISGNTSVYAIVTDGTCASQIVEITLTVDNNLTAFPTADSQCDDGSGTATFDLTTLENTVNGGNGNTVNWYSDAAAATSIPTTIISGNTSVYAIVTDGTCASQIVEITLTVDNNLTAFPTTDSQCDDGSGTATFDLTTLENTVNGGNGNTVNWYSDAGATTPISTTIISVNTSVYAIVTDGTCSSQAVEIDLFISSNSINNIIQTLCDGESLLVNNVVYDELNTLGTEIISGGNMNGCDSIINVDLTFEPEITGTISASTNSICPGNDVILTFNLTGGTTYDVEYSEGGNPPTILNGISDGHTITVAPNVTTSYSLEAVTPLNTNCIAVIPTTQITIQVEALDIIVISIGSVGGFDIVCANGNTGAAVAAPTNGLAPFTYLWSNGATTDIASSLTAGTYEVTITDANGCAGISSITLTEPTLVEFDVMAIAPPCLDIMEGQIIFDNITGGVGNYSYSFDGSPFTNVINDTTILDLVTIGEHSIFILDGNGCGFEEIIIVPEAVELTLELGDDQTIELGESFEIQPQTNFPVSNILWSENTSCDTCFTQLVSPVNETTYTLELFDENGCFVTDEITILVEKNRNVFIPNAFSPDENGFNDIFYINAGQDVVEVKNFRIFNRWGEVVFENENFQPNEPTEGWDGFFNGEKLNPSVLVFFAEIEFKDGEVKIYKGDVTLTR